MSIATWPIDAIRARRAVLSRSAPCPGTSAHIAGATSLKEGMDLEDRRCHGTGGDRRAARRRFPFQLTDAGQEPTHQIRTAINATFTGL
jgi:hypothetical protein